jgi:O-antigen/teichoic acid export membrane protein
LFSSLLKDAPLYSASALLARGFSLITVPIFTRFLTPADYGILDLLSFLVVLIPLIFGLALDQAIGRYYVDTNDYCRRKKIASSVLIYTIIVIFVAIVIMLQIDDFIIEEWLDGKVNSATLYLLSVLIWLHSIFIVTNNQLRYMFRAKEFALSNIGNTILSMTLSVTFVSLLGFGVDGVFLGQAISQGIFAFVSFWLARESYALVFDWRIFKEMLRYSIPLMPSTIAFMGMQYVDRIILNELRPIEEVGLYGIGARLASLVNLFLMGFQAAWAPLVIKHYKDSNARAQFAKVFIYYLFITICILITISIFSKEILLLLTTPEFSHGYVVVPLLIASIILSSIGSYFSYGIKIHKKTHIRLYINMFGFLLNILLNYVLIVRLGIIGAALATLASFAIMAILSLHYSQRYYRVPYSWPQIIGAGVFAALVANLVLVINDFELTIVFLLVKLSIVTVSLYFVSQILRIKSISELLLILRKDKVN